MIMKYIVKNNNIFEAIECNEYLPNLVLLSPSKFGEIKKYTIIPNNIQVEWCYEEKPTRSNYVNFLYHDTIFYTLNSSNNQNVCDIMNYFNSMDKKEFEKYFNECLTDKKSTLELEINELIIKRDTIKSQIQILKDLILGLEV